MNWEYLKSHGIKISRVCSIEPLAVYAVQVSPLKLEFFCISQFVVLVIDLSHYQKSVSASYESENVNDFLKLIAISLKKL